MTLTRDYSETYVYDAVGNMLSLTHSAVEQSFVRQFAMSPAANPFVAVPRDNRLHSMQMGSTNYGYTYDTNGNLTDETTSRHF